MEDELASKCVMIIDEISEKCMPLTVNSESKVFFLKMIGDFHRYQAEHMHTSQFAHLENRTFQEKKAVMMKNTMLEKIEKHY